MNPAVHPAFAEALASITSLHGRVAELNLHRPVYFPTVGDLTRRFTSLGDVMAYESGWISYIPGDRAPQANTPFYDGWCHAFATHERHAMDSLHQSDDDGGCEVPA